MRKYLIRSQSKRNLSFLDLTKMKSGKKVLDDMNITTRVSTYFVLKVSVFVAMGTVFFASVGNAAIDCDLNPTAPICNQEPEPALNPSSVPDPLPAPTPPFRGSVSWSVLLCTFSDSETPSKTPSFYGNMFITPGTGGLYDYWQSVSYGGLNLNGSVVKGWYTEPFTFAQAQARSRQQRFQDCIDAAQNSPIDPYTVPPNQFVAVITAPDLDLFGLPGKGAFLPSSIDLGGMAHEFGHGLGLNHSFSDDPNYRNADWAQIGEYDDQWDLMSYAHVFDTLTSQFGSGGPGLNAHHVDRMGWLPLPRILTFGADNTVSQTVTLAALNHPEASGYLLVRIPFDPADLFHYYTVEFRRNDGWDAGFPNDTVLIHEVKRGEDGQYYTYLLRNHSGSRAPVQSLNANGVTINVNSISPQTNQASVTITNDIADRCLQGYVWREANTSDHVCVPPATRTQASNDNAQASARRSPTGGAYGPDTCTQGYVWRDAFPGDHVCVTPDIRTQASADNQAAANRKNPARFVYGPNTCKQGFVWREADSSDYVCVPPATRTQASNDNAQASARRSPTGGAYGPDTCIQGYVWRDAFPGDHVCVTPDIRTQASADNQAAGIRLLKP